MLCGPSDLRTSWGEMKRKSATASRFGVTPVASAVSLSFNALRLHLRNSFDSTRIISRPYVSGITSAVVKLISHRNQVPNLYIIRIVRLALYYGALFILRPYVIILFSIILPPPPLLLVAVMWWSPLLLKLTQVFRSANNKVTAILRTSS